MTHLVWVTFCNLVLTRSKGWNKTVEQVPLIEPARNDLNMGCCKYEYGKYEYKMITEKWNDCLHHSIHQLMFCRFH